MHFCIFCKVIVPSHNLINITLSTTRMGNINIEDFIKDNILHLHTYTKLHSNYLCTMCYNTINQLEEYLINSKSIQELLSKQYEEPEVPIKEEEPLEGSFNNFEQEEGAYSEETDLPIILNPEIEVRRIKKVRKSHTKEITCSTDEDEEAESQHNIRIKLERIGKKEKEKEQSMKTYCCEICGQHYVNYNGFNIHMRTHKNENAFRCETCNKTFTQKIGLQRHMDIHSGVYPYTCEQCGKRYIHQKSYKIHLDIHSGKRDYQCDLCGLGLLTTSHLQRHMKTHTREKTFGCNECGRMFAEKYNLVAHKKIHARQSQDIPIPSALVQVTTKDEVVT